MQHMCVSASMDLRIKIQKNFERKLWGFPKILSRYKAAEATEKALQDTESPWGPEDGRSSSRADRALREGAA